MPAPISARPGRNQPCHCGSGRKYKHCCLEKDDARATAERAKAAAAAAARSSEAATPAPARAPKHQTDQPWKATPSRGLVRACERHARSVAAEQDLDDRTRQFQTSPTHSSFSFRQSTELTMPKFFRDV
ncbi:MAG: hypothetical protein DMF92_21940 [Acidobacteria bacterium]|nr:MAG: hypothetical protein DMF92_21940 [Acidobacteriota bacterium]